MHLLALEHIDVAGVDAGSTALAFQWQFQLLAELTHPADLSGGNPDHQGVGGHILVDHCTSSHKGILANGDPTYDGAVGPQGGALFYQGVTILVFALDQGAGIVYVGKHHAGATEHALFEMYVVVDRDVVLDFAIVADGDLVADEHVLPQGHALTDACAATDMDEMPDARAFANLRAFIDYGAGVLVMTHGSTQQARKERVAFVILGATGCQAADGFDSFHAVPRILDAVALAIENGLVADGVQVSEAFGKLDFGTITGDRAVGRLHALDRVRQVVGVDGEEPAHARVLVLQIASGLGFVDVVHDVALQLAEDEVQHVVEMHTDIGGHAERFARVTLPAFHIPLAAAGDVGQLDVVLVVLLARLDLLLQIDDRLMVAQLQDVVQTATGLLLGKQQVVEHRGAGHQRLFADHVTTEAQTRVDMRVVQVVGRADRHDIQGGRRIALQAPGMVVETLELGEELTLRREAVDDADRVVDVVGTGQLVAGVLDGTHVARGDVAGSADKGESFHAVSRKRLERAANAPDENLRPACGPRKNTQALMTFACGARYLPRLSTSRRACC